MNIGVDLTTSMGYQGTEVFADNLILSLSTLSPTDQFFIYGTKQFVPLLVEHALPNVQFVEPRLESRIGRAFEQQCLLPFKTRRDRIDVIFSPSPFSSLFARGKKIVTIHDAAYKRFPEYRSTISRAYFSAAVFIAKHTAKKFITVSQFSKTELETYYHIKPSSIHIVENALPQTSEGGNSTNRSLIDFGINTPYIIFIGTPRPRKNLDGLLKAFAIARTSESKLKLVLVGAFDKRFTASSKRIQELNLESSIIQTGFVTNAEKSTLLAQSVALVFPSLYEGFGLPILEAQQANTPVICSNTSATPHTAGDGAMLVDPLNPTEIAGAITRLVSDASARNTLINRGAANLERFSWQTSATKLKTIF
ncbi:glycosyltransferase family 4 protein [Candidatus Uhrbacteria bacterium]|jgi:glycosyltransferase involved in cell wall biosynthesis|nr:glycosyltransferase family 4 protein [Candidatus Uhrbacteria bacterium]